MSHLGAFLKTGALSDLLKGTAIQTKRDSNVNPKLWYNDDAQSSIELDYSGSPSEPPQQPNMKPSVHLPVQLNTYQQNLKLEQLDQFQIIKGLQAVRGALVQTIDEDDVAPQIHGFRTSPVYFINYTPLFECRKTVEDQKADLYGINEKIETCLKNSESSNINKKKYNDWFTAYTDSPKDFDEGYKEQIIMYQKYNYFTIDPTKNQDLIFQSEDNARDKFAKTIIGQDTTFYDFCFTEAADMYYTYNKWWSEIGSVIRNSTNMNEDCKIYTLNQMRVTCIQVFYICYMMLNVPEVMDKDKIKEKVINCMDYFDEKTLEYFAINLFTKLHILIKETKHLQDSHFWQNIIPDLDTERANLCSTKILLKLRNPLTAFFNNSSVTEMWDFPFKMRHKMSIH